MNISPPKKGTTAYQKTVFQRGYVVIGGVTIYWSSLPVSSRPGCLPGASHRPRKRRPDGVPSCRMLFSVQRAWEWKVMNLASCPPKIPIPSMYGILGGGFKYFYFHSYLQKWSKLSNVLQMGWIMETSSQYIFTYTFVWLIFYGFYVGKFTTRPMDA